MANLVLFRRLEVMAANRKETITQRRAEKSVLETSIKLNLDILIARISNNYCCESKVCMQFLCDDDYQLNNTVRRLEARPYYVQYIL